MGHDDWQRLLLSNSTSIRLHLFLSYCVCLPLNLTRQRLSILRGARARVQSRSEDERRERASDGHSNWFQTKLFTHWEGKDDPIQLTWWQLDVGFCLFFFHSDFCLVLLTFFFLNWRSFSSWFSFFFFLLFPNTKTNSTTFAFLWSLTVVFFFFFLSRVRLLPPFPGNLEEGEEEKSR